MEEFTLGTGVLERAEDRSRLALVMNGRRFTVLDSSSDSFLIEAPADAALRGLADLYEDDRHVAQCLIVLAAPEGALMRCGFKRRTLARDTPPRDFA